VPRRYSTVHVARGATAPEALSALLADLAATVPDADPDTVLVIQARAEHDGSGFVATATLWRYDRLPPELAETVRPR
jgi:hypothetical protein